MAKKKNNIASPPIGVQAGPRYVFFSSLKDASTPMYQRLYNEGMSYLNKATSALHEPVSFNGEQMDRISAYGQLMSKTAQTQLNQEIKFLHNMQTKLKKQGKLTQQLEDAFNIFFSNNCTNYLQLIALMDRMVKENTKKQKQIEEIILHNAKIIEQRSKEYEQTRDKANDEQQSLEELFKTNIGKYNKKIYELIREDVESDNFRQSYSNLLAQKINSTLSILIHSPTMLESLKQNLVLVIYDGDMANFGMQITGMIVKQLESMSIQKLEKNTDEDIAMEVLGNILDPETFKEQIKQMTTDYLELINEQTTRRSGKKKPLEQIIIETGRDTAKLYSQLDPIMRQSFVTRYIDPKNEQEMQLLRQFNEELNKDPKHRFSSRTLREVSTVLNRNVIQKMSEAIGEDAKKLINQIRGKNGRKLKYSTVMAKISNSTFALQHALSVNISGSALKEVTTTQQIIQSLGSSIKSISTPGKTTKLKADITVNVNFQENKFSQDAKINLKLNRMADLFPVSFMKIYKKRAKQTTNVQIASQSFKDSLQHIKQQVENLKKRGLISVQEEQQFLQSISQYIRINISVKQYTYTGNIGFHGGTLGPDLSGVINNIQNMYDLGGLTKMDTDMLYFAIANCGPDSIGSNIKGDLQTYLAGAAALMMFDEGFTSLEKYMKDLKSSLGFDASPGIHLFQVGDKLIPASVIYKSIATSVDTITNDINTQMTNVINKNQNAVTINNIVTQDKIKDFKDYPSAQARWDAMSQYAEKSLNGSTISFTFMAGILDILESIPKAFENIKI